MDIPKHQDTYTTSLPEPPRVIVPPPGDIVPRNTSRSRPRTDTFMSGPDEDDIADPRRSSYDPSKIDRNKFRLFDPRSDDENCFWAYADRRKSQEILSFLHLGPWAVARDPKFLIENDFTFLLVVRQAARMDPSAPARLPPMAVRVAQEQGIATQVFDVMDNQSLIHQMSQILASLASHMNARREATGDVGRVLLACETGNERSATVCVAYLMESLNMSLIPAIQFVQHRRFCINIDDDKKQMLLAFEDMIKARRDVAASNLGSLVPQADVDAVQNATYSWDANGSYVRPVAQSGAAPPSQEAMAQRRPSKRALDDDDDDDDGSDRNDMMDGDGVHGLGAGDGGMDMNGDSDGGRRGVSRKRSFQPFTDSET